jgi:hypothetical protein
MAKMRRTVVVVSVGIAALMALTSCENLTLPAYVKLDTSGALNVAGCYSIDDVSTLTMFVTTHVAGDERSFMDHEIEFVGPPFDLAEEEPIVLPYIADGWTSDPDYMQFDDWTNASISINGEDATQTFNRADLTPGEWIRVGPEDTGCPAPD